MSRMNMALGGFDDQVELARLQDFCPLWTPSVVCRRSRSMDSPVQLSDEPSARWPSLSHPIVRRGSIFVITVVVDLGTGRHHSVQGALESVIF